MVPSPPWRARERAAARSAVCGAGALAPRLVLGIDPGLDGRWPLLEVVGMPTLNGEGAKNRRSVNPVPRAAWYATCCLAFMMKNSKVLFRPGSRLPVALGVPADTVGTVICKYSVSHPAVGCRERIDVRFESGRVAWGVPSLEFILSESDDAHGYGADQAA